MKKSLVLFVFTLIAAIAIGQKQFCSNRKVVTTNPNSGFVSINELHYGSGLGKTKTGPYAQQYTGFTSVLGYHVNIHGQHINRSFIAGAGTGVFVYEAGPLVPLFLDFRYLWNFKRVSPYVFEDSGAILDIQDLLNGSKMFINPGIGIKHKISNSLAVSLGTGLFVQMGGDLGTRESYMNYKLGLVYKPRWLVIGN
jgi:hypothetical protein